MRKELLKLLENQIERLGDLLEDPLDFEQFNDPVILEDGTTYSRESIQTAFATKPGISPLGQQEVNQARLTNNRIIVDIITEYNQLAELIQTIQIDEESQENVKNQEEAPPTLKPLSFVQLELLALVSQLLMAVKKRDNDDFIRSVEQIGFYIDRSDGKELSHLFDISSHLFPLRDFKLTDDCFLQAGCNFYLSIVKVNIAITPFLHLFSLLTSELHSKINGHDQQTFNMDNPVFVKFLNGFKQGFLSENNNSNNSNNSKVSFLSRRFFSSKLKATKSKGDIKSYYFLVLGGARTGKHNIIRRLLALGDNHNEFTKLHTVYTRVIYGDQEVLLAFKRIFIEHERLSWLVRSVDAYIIVCDVTNRDSLNTAKGQIERANIYGPQRPKILLANKIDDKVHRQISEDELHEFEKQHNIECVEVSATTGEGFDIVIDTLLMHSAEADYKISI